MVVLLAVIAIATLRVPWSLSVVYCGQPDEVLTYHCVDGDAGGGPSVR